MKARMLFSIWALLVTSAKADANENHVVVPPSRHSDLALPVEGSPEHSAGDRVGSEVLADRTHQEVSSEAKDEESEKKDESIVVAMEEKSGASIRSGEIVSTKDEAAVYINRENIKLELSPRSVGEFDSKGEFRLLRGSAVLESRKETTMQTTGSRVD